MSDTQGTVNYKDTINLPKTDFPMKGNLGVREPEFIQNWISNQIYFKMVKENSEKGSFTLPDGPPYANGNIHIGHALNKVLKDVVIKYKNMNGYAAPFIPGWDCHGLPIEHAVTKDMKEDQRKSLTDKELRKLCRQEALKWIAIQKEEFKRFGVMADWENPYLTLQPDYEAEEVRVLADILETGAFYYGTKPVYWCWALKTALAEAEVEYKNHKSISIYLKFKVRDGKGSLNKDTSLVIWTTTPWTIPANLAISVHPEFQYGLYESNGETLLLAEGLADAFQKDSGLTLGKKIKTILGSDLEGISYLHPMFGEAEKHPAKFDSQKIFKVILGTHVTLEAGTGLVHTATGHGVEDYAVGLKYDLPIFSPVNEEGRYTPDIAAYQGQHVLKEANKKIAEELKEKGNLISAKEFEHSYPHCWRSKTPLIFRATPQWFLKMDMPNPSKGNETIRQKSLKAIKEVKWVPGWGENRISSMIENRPDWCLSRQRVWGVPIPVLYCKKCSTPLADAEVMNRIADKMENTKTGIDAYYDTDAAEFSKGHKCEKCSHTEFDKGKDILDVWFDSGICWSAVQKKRAGLTQPADLYLEGSDQHRGWFHTSLLASVAATGEAPFKTVLTHGFVMFSKGQKMSKSLGNIVTPQEIISKSGSDILRLWAAHEDYSQDLTCNPETIERLTETYRRLRNTVRFLLGNLYDFDPKKDALAYKDLTRLDQWALAKLNVLVAQITEAYDNYEFYKIYHLLNNFVTVDLSAFYLDILKDRLYVRKKDGQMRRSAQTVLYEVTTAISKLMAPILSFLAEETYQFTLGKTKESIFLEKIPTVKKDWENQEVLNTFDIFSKIRTDALKKLEELRTQKVIGSGLEAQLTVTADGEQFKVLELLKDSLAEFFIVSKVTLNKGAYDISASKTEGQKCVRCWTYSTQLNSSSKFPETCPKCVEALS